MNPALVFTDDLLEADGIDDAERFLLALVLGHPDHAPSKRAIRAALPLNDAQIAQARRQIAAQRLAYIDRPTERTPGTQRFNRAPRFKRFAAEVDPRRAGVRFSVFPVALTKLLRGRGGLAACRLAVYYHREQWIRGAIQVPDSVAAWRLGWPLEKVKRTRQRLVRGGIIETVSRATSHAPATYVMPDAHAKAAPGLEGFDPERTRYLWPLEVGGAAVTAYASAAERGLLERLLAEAAQVDSTADVLARFDNPIVAKAALPVLEGRMGNTRGADRKQVRGELRTETTQPSSLPPRNDEEEATKKATKKTRARRQWPPEWLNLYYDADDRTHEQIAAFACALEATYGLADARSMLRAACLPSRASGAAVLAALKAAHERHDPEQADRGLSDDLLDGIYRTVET